MMRVERKTVPIKEAPPTPPRQPLMPVTQWAIIILLVFNLLALWVIFSNQGAGEQRGYKNRAVTCDMIKALGLKESPECLADEVKPYRSQDAGASQTAGARNSKTTLIAVCQMAQSLELVVPECYGTG